MQIADIHHVSLNVSDLERSVGFYCELLGMTLVPRPEIPVEGVWLDAGHGRQVHLIVADVPDDCGQHVAFVVTDIDEAVAELRDAGVRISDPFSVADTGIRQAFGRDPDGNRLEFTQPA